MRSLTPEQREQRNAKSRAWQKARYRHDPAYRAKRVVENRARYGHVPRGTVPVEVYAENLLSWWGLA